MEKNNEKYQVDHSFLSEPVPYGELSLVQVGRLFLNENGGVSEHTHLNWFELTAVTDGEGEVVTNGHRIPVERGDLFFSYPGDFHAITTGDSHPLKFDYLAFWTEDEGLAFRLLDIEQRHPTAESRRFRDGRIDAMIADILAEWESGEPSCEMVETALRYVVLRVLHDFEESTASHAEIADSKRALCYRIMTYIDSHIFSVDSLKDLTDVMNYRYSYLSEVFRKTTGDTIAHYFRDRRLEAGKLLLGEGKMTVSEVAEKLGYSSVYSFSRSYKALFGVCPTGLGRKQK
ncbi:MAG: AraC family transcriptional regulator [Clostridia bacterium]|nr:AraC family transcriptional regulator [Clostridia bacterium]